MSVDESALPAGQPSPHSRSVQAYIDETPLWADGTPVLSTPMTNMQWRIWTLAAAGKFFEGLVVFMTGVALPLIAEEFKITPAQHGVVGAASLFGILIGAIGLGGLSDYFGRKSMFIVEMIIFMIFLVLLVASPNYFWLVVFLFGLGVALGCDYPTAHLIISESIPSSLRGRLVLGAFGFQALGAMTGTVVGYLVLKNIPEIGAWRWMYATAIIPALIVTIGRFSITESAHWLLVRGRRDDARTQLARLLARRPTYPKSVEFTTPVATAGSRQSFLALFDKTNLRATVLASVPWFLQDLGTWHWNFYAYDPRRLDRSQDRPCTEPRRPHQQRRAGGQGSGSDRFAADRGYRLRHPSGKQNRQHPTTSVGLYRLRRWPVHRRCLRVHDRWDSHPAHLRRVHAVQLHDQPRTKCADLPACRRSVSNPRPGHGRRFRRGFREDRCGRNCVFVSHPARPYWYSGSPMYPGGNIAARRCRHVAVPHRHHRREPRADRKI
jgi:Sugar (and other) transporter